jgi:PIN domain nuclease of toxin-antitoxin system
VKLLLDTHVLLWWLFELPQLGKRASHAIQDPASEVFVSALAAGEIEVKRAIGKMDGPKDLPVQVEQNGFTELPFTLRHGSAMRELPLHHKDPFDRMLIAQAPVQKG